MQPIRGILTPNITPVDAQGRVYHELLAGYIDWLIERGVDGLYPNGSTGEFVRFTPTERREIVATVLRAARGRVPVLAGAAEANAEETIAACNAYGEMGVRAVAIVAPFYYRLSPDGVYAYFRAIADAVRVDITLYNIPLFASPIDVPTVRRLAEECPRVCGIKDSSGDISHMLRMIAAVRPIRPDFSFLTGWDTALVPMLMCGADGGTNATSGVVPELTRAIFQACQHGDLGRALQLQHALLPLFDLMIGTPEFPEGFRAGARVRGWDLGTGRQPLTLGQRGVSEAARSKLETMIPAAAAQTSLVQLRPQDLDEIVRRVLAQL